MDNGSTNNPSDFNEQLKTNESENRPVKKEMPKVKPSTIVMTCIFALLFTIGFTFFPYFEMLLPFGGTTYNTELHIEELNHAQLIEKADSVIIGKVVEKSDARFDDSVNPGDGLNFIVYKEVTVQVSEVLYGKPLINDNKLITYELGASYIDKSMGKPKKITIRYKDYAKLDKNTNVLLFLDAEGYVLNEKYGLYKQHTNGYFFDYKDDLYSISTIKEELQARS